MLKAIFNWFVGGKPTVQQPAPTVSPEAAPYKVEPPPPPVQPTLTVDGHGDVQGTPAKPKAEKKPAAKKAPAKPKAEKKPAAIKAPKKPKAKKAEK